MPRRIRAVQDRAGIQQATMTQILTCGYILYYTSPHQGCTGIHQFRAGNNNTTADL